MVQTRRILLEGLPGVGKTTVVARLIARLRDAGVPVGGFITRELRDRGRRVGFAIEEIDSPGAVIAHVDWTHETVVGRYHVDVQALERIALPALQRARDQAGVVLIDELGRMELTSEAFVRAIQDLFRRDVPLVATVHIAAHPMTDALKRRPDVQLMQVTTENRDRLPGLLGELLMQEPANHSQIPAEAQDSWPRSRELPHRPS